MDKREKIRVDLYNTEQPVQKLEEFKDNQIYFKDKAIYRNPTYMKIMISSISEKHQREAKIDMLISDSNQVSKILFWECNKIPILNMALIGGLGGLISSGSWSLFFNLDLIKLLDVGLACIRGEYVAGIQN